MQADQMQMIYTCCQRASIGQVSAQFFYVSNAFGPHGLVGLWVTAHMHATLTSNGTLRTPARDLHA